MYMYIYILTHLHLDICASKICHQRLSSSSASWSPASSTTVTGAKTRTDAVDLRAAGGTTVTPNESTRRNETIQSSAQFSSRPLLVLVSSCVLLILLCRGEEHGFSFCFCSHQWPRNSIRLSILPMAKSSESEDSTRNPIGHAKSSPAPAFRRFVRRVPKMAMAHETTEKNVSSLSTLWGDFWDFCYVAML